ncbi:hypothetical protein PoB_001276700 [Plakobranchus ocellatus]|uniref:Uncharacterized protein n=1 Tax=Plakobranchus ocellatus TaxID=259542 RepID=A0AAV3YUW1_9GAST|nr:hypothetical protein PoB_001276700 [Plakobranchus ocellatus]
MCGQSNYFKLLAHQTTMTAVNFTFAYYYDILRPGVSVFALYVFMKYNTVGRLFAAVSPISTGLPTLRCPGSSRAVVRRQSVGNYLPLVSGKCSCRAALEASFSGTAKEN